MNKKSEIVIIVLFILVMSLGGFIIYDKTINKKNEPVKEEIVDQSTEKIYEKYASKVGSYISKNMYFPIDEFSYPNPIKKIVLTKGKKAYAVLNENILAVNPYTALENQTSSKLEDIGCDALGYCDKGYFLGVENVIKIYIVRNGNENSIFLLNNKGEVYAINASKLKLLPPEVVIDVYKIEGLKNIYSINSWVNDIELNVYTTDIEGNVVLISDKLK